MIHDIHYVLHCQFFEMYKLPLNWLAFLLLLILFNFIPPTKQGNTIQLREIRSNFNVKYISNCTIAIKNQTLNMDIFLKRILNYGFRANLEFQLRLKNSNKYQTLFSHNIDVCAMVTSLRESILKKWFNSLMKYGNFMDNCPVNEGHYYLRGWRWDATLIPVYLYPGDYRVKGHGFYGKYKSKQEDFVVHCEMDLTLL